MHPQPQFIIEPGSCYSITAQLNYHNGQPVRNSPVIGQPTMER